jgi:hypothetical protein
MVLCNIFGLLVLRYLEMPKLTLFYLLKVEIVKYNSGL